MGDLILFVFLLVSQNFGPQVAGYETPTKCNEARAEVMALVESAAPDLGDAVYVGPCQKIVLKRYSKPV